VRRKYTEKRTETPLGEDKLVKSNNGTDVGNTVFYTNISCLSVRRQSFRRFLEQGFLYPYKYSNYLPKGENFFIQIEYINIDTKKLFLLLIHLFFGITDVRLIQLTDKRTYFMLYFETLNSRDTARNYFEKYLVFKFKIKGIGTVNGSKLNFDNFCETEKKKEREKEEEKGEEEEEEEEEKKKKNEGKKKEIQRKGKRKFKK
jgi:hypothetical protein